MKQKAGPFPRAGIGGKRQDNDSRTFPIDCGAQDPLFWPEDSSERREEVDSLAPAGEETTAFCFSRIRTGLGTIDFGREP